MKGSLIVDYTEKIKNALLMKIQSHTYTFRDTLNKFSTIEMQYFNTQRIRLKCGKYLIEFNNVL